MRVPGVCLACYLLRKGDQCTFPHRYRDVKDEPFIVQEYFPTETPILIGRSHSPSLPSLADLEQAFDVMNETCEKVMGTGYVLEVDSDVEHFLIRSKRISVPTPFFLELRLDAFGGEPRLIDPPGRSTPSELGGVLDEAFLLTLARGLENGQNFKSDNHRRVEREAVDQGL